MTPAKAIETLIAGGLTETEIGQAVGVRQSSINKIKNGGGTDWELGKKLVDLAASTRTKPAKRRAA